MNDYNAAHKQIEDIIDAKKESGQYDILVNNLKPFTPNSNVRYAYTAPNHSTVEARDEFGTFNIEGDNNNDFRYHDVDYVGPTDSEITLIRVKREGSQILRDTQEKVIPGDGTHLRESPSLVNLATLMVPSKQCFKSSKKYLEQEYLVPLSSWEPGEPSHKEYTKDNMINMPSHGQDSTGNSGVDDPVRPKHICVESAAMTEQKSISSFKELFKCFAFWKRDKNENV